MVPNASQAVTVTRDRDPSDTGSLPVKPGDGVLFYHSSCLEPGIAGVVDQILLQLRLGDLVRRRQHALERPHRALLGLLRALAKDGECLGGRLSDLRAAQARQEPLSVVVGDNLGRPGELAVTILRCSSITGSGKSRFVGPPALRKR